MRGSWPRKFRSDEIAPLSAITGKNDVEICSLLTRLSEKSVEHLRAINRIIWNIEIARAMREKFPNKDAYSVPFLILMCETVAKHLNPKIQDRCAVEIVITEDVRRKIQEKIYKQDELLSPRMIETNVIINCLRMARNDFFHGDGMYHFSLPNGDEIKPSWKYKEKRDGPVLLVSVYGQLSYEELEKILVEACLEYLEI